MTAETRLITPDFSGEGIKKLQELGFSGGFRLQDEKGFVVQGSKFWKEKFSGRLEQEDERIKKRRATSTRQLIQALSRRTAARRVIQLAKNFVYPLIVRGKRLNLGI